MQTIVKVLFGSHLYGTATKDSDLDYKTVFLPTEAQILLQKVPEANNTRFTSQSGVEADLESYSLQKYLKLLAQGQPNAIEMYFVPWAKRSINSHYWDEVMKSAPKFITKKSSAFFGYCKQQANKYSAKAERVKAVEEVLQLLRKFNYKELLGRYHIELDYFCDGVDHTSIDLISVSDGNNIISHLNVCNKLVPFTHTVEQAIAVYEKLYAEYGKRAKAAKGMGEVDWKAMSHALRIGQEAIELFSTGFITLPRPNAQYLLGVKTGQYAYEKISEEIDELLAEVEDSAAKSRLPAEPDYELMNNLVMEMYRGQIHDAKRVKGES